MAKILCRGGWLFLFITLTALADGVPSIIFQKPFLIGAYRVTTDPSGRVIAVGSAYGCVQVTNGSFNSSTQLSVSVDAGASWGPLSNLPCDNGEPSVPWSLSIARTGPPIIYAATGTSIFESGDNGRSWTPTAPVPQNSVACPPGLNFVIICANGITAFAADPSQPSILYAASGTGLFKSTDAGARWTQIKGGSAAAPFPVLLQYLTIDPFHTNTIYTYTRAAGYRSFDGAQSWQQYTIPGSVGVLTVFFDPIRAGIIYAVDVGSNLFRSIDDGSSWVLVSADKRTLAFDPVNAGVMYSLDGLGIEKSTDGGITWNVVLPALANVYLGFKIAVDPFDPSVVLTSTMRSDDGGATWRPISVAGEYYRDFVFDPRTPGRVFVATQPTSDAVLAIYGGDGVLQFGTYFGGQGDDRAQGVATDGAGNIYVTGSTSSVDFPTTAGAVQSALAGVQQAFVTKFSPDGNVVYSTYLGGQSSNAYAIAVDSAGEAIIAGSTSSDMLGAQPLTDTSPNPNFIAKLAADGKSLVFARLFNGVAGALAVDSGGDIVMLAASVLRLDSAGNFVSSTLLGGPPYGSVSFAAFDRDNNIYIAGTTGSKNLPVTPGAYQTELHSNCPYPLFYPLINIGAPIFPDYNGDDAFITKFTSAGEVVFSTYLGGYCDDRVSGVSVDASGNVWLTGNTNSNPFPQRGAFETGPVGPSYLGESYGTFKGFVSELDASGAKLLFSSYVTGFPSWITSDAFGNTYFDYHGLTKLAGAASTMLIDSAGNAFGTRDGPLSPGEITQITLEGFTPENSIDLRINSSAPLPLTLGGTQVLFDGVAAPIMTVGPNRIVCITPYSIDGQKTTTVQVSFGGNVSNAVIADVVPTDPFLLTADGTGSGQAVARNQDGSLNAPDHPAHAGEIVTFFYTGGGVTSPASTAGAITGDPPPVPVALPYNSGGSIVSVSELPGFVSGLFQLKVYAGSTISLSPTQTLKYWVTAQ